jgi:hypothetical protein
LTVGSNEFETRVLEHCWQHLFEASDLLKSAESLVVDVSCTWQRKHVPIPLYNNDL